MEATTKTPLVKRPDFAALPGRQLARYLAVNASYGTGDDALRSPEEKVAAANLVFDRKLENFAAALVQLAELDREAQAASEALQVFPRGAMGLTPDEVKFSEPYKAASARYNRAHTALRAFNGPFTKRFAAELSEHRMAVRQSKLLQNNG